MIENLDVSTFKEKIFNYGPKSQEWKFEGDKPAIVEYSANWCSPCKALEPTLKELSEEYEGLVDFYKVDVEDNSEIAIKFGIKAIPSMLFIPMTGTPQMAQGALPKDQLKNSIDNVLLRKKDKEKESDKVSESSKEN